MRTITICALALVLASCDSRQRLQVEREMDASEPDLGIAESKAVAVYNETPPQRNVVETATSQIIKTADYKFQVTNVDSSTYFIEKSAESYGASISNMNLETSNYEITNTIAIRVPAAQFEKLIATLGSQAIYTNYKKISAQDVTEEFVDIQTRLKTKKEVRDRYVDILKTKAKTIEDVLKAEEQIRVLQEEIEAKEGRLKFLTSRVALSTINLEIYQTVDYKPAPDTHQVAYGSQFIDGLGNGWKIITGTVLVLANLWPLLILIGVVIWKRKWFRKKIMTEKVSS